MRTLWPIGAAIAAMCFVLAVTLTPAKSAEIDPNAMMRSGFTTKQEVEIYTIGSGIGALRHCALKFKKPQYEVTAKTIYFTVMQQLFTPDNNHGGRRDRLTATYFMLFDMAYADGIWRSAVWTDDKNVQDVALPMAEVADCDALDAWMRDTVTKPDNIYNYGPTFEEMKDADA